MSTQTVSEKYFEQLCRTKGITSDRLAEGERQKADYQIKIGSIERGFVPWGPDEIVP